MSDYYTTFTAEETIKCSEEEFNALVKSIGIEKGVKIDGGEALTATHEESALSVEFSPKENELYIYGEQNASVDAIPAKFIEELGKLLKIRKLPFLEFGVAFTCSKAGPGSHGGDAFRITDGGKLTPEWKRLFERYPDRFLLGSDTWISQRWDSYGSIMAEYRGWLAQLPQGVAEKIAYRNAEKLFKR